MLVAFWRFQSTQEQRCANHDGHDQRKENLGQAEQEIDNEHDEHRRECKFCKRTK
jgi:hypothetical protein